MIFHEYKSHKFSPPQIEKIETALRIIKQHAAGGYDLTLRQLYYQFVSKDLIPNKQTEYDNLGKTVSRARIAGLLPWDAIVDRTRNMIANAQWETRQGRIKSAARTYNMDCWENQPNRLEVWIEKEALIGVITDVCRNNDVTHFACKGYTSQSEMWAASQRLLAHSCTGQSVHIIHLGDHDPSGVDMTRDIKDRLAMFMGDEAPEVHRIALNMDQIEQYGAPPNPTKLSDGRAKKYMRDTGCRSSWELDALDPDTIAELVESTIETYRDGNLWDEKLEEERESRDRLHRIADRWSEVEDLIE